MFELGQFEKIQYNIYNAKLDSSPNASVSNSLQRTRCDKLSNLEILIQR